MSSSKDEQMKERPEMSPRLPTWYEDTKKAPTAFYLIKVSASLKRSSLYHLSLANGLTRANQDQPAQLSFN